MNTTSRSTENKKRMWLSRAAYFEIRYGVRTPTHLLEREESYISRIKVHLRIKMVMFRCGVGELLVIFILILLLC
jgi:hypothetical protein